MAWFNKKEEEKNRTLSQLSLEEKDELTQLLLDGAPVSELAQMYNLSSQSLYVMRRSLTTPRITPQNGRTVGNPDVERTRQEIEKLKAEAELERVKEELDYQRKLRALTLREKELDIQAREAELNEDDDFDISDAADDPENAMWGFFKEIIKRGGVRGANTPPVAAAPVEDFPPRPPPLDMSKEHDKIDIETEMLIRFSEEQLKRAASVPFPIVSAQIKEQFPNITENNLKHIAEVLRHYEHK